jgi:hypothetical protein
MQKIAREFFFENLARLRTPLIIPNRRSISGGQYRGNRSLSRLNERQNALDGPLI